MPRNRFARLLLIMKPFYHKRAFSVVCRSVSEDGEKAAPRSLLAGCPSAKMGTMTTVAISLKDEDQHFLEEVVKSGRYLSESEVVA